MPAPPDVRLPVPLQSLGFMVREAPLLRRLQREYGDVFTLRIGGGLPPFVVIADPALVKAVFTGDPAMLRAGEGNEILEPVVGSTSVLLLDGAAHLRQRKLLLPSFQGDRMRLYGGLMTEVIDAEIDRWPIGEPFALHPCTNRFALRVILRAVFGIEDAGRLADLERLLPGMLDLGQWGTMLPFVQHDLGPRSPWGRFLRERDAVDAILFDEIARRRNDPATPDRTDVLSLMVQARFEDGTAMTDQELRDECLTMLVAGHETTATTLAWTFERLTRHPEALARLAAEARAGESADFADAAIKETMRVRPVLNYAMRRLPEPIRLGEWDIPAGHQLAISLLLVGLREDAYPEPLAWRPERFLDGAPDAYTWIPFGGGVRRCLGAAFAQYEMRIAVQRIAARTDLAPSAAPSERRRRRAITMVPEHGALITVTRREPAAAPAADPALAAA